MKLYNIIVIVMLSSCTFDPWQITLYKNLETENIGFYGISDMPNEIKYNKNYLNGAFIDIGTKGKDATVYSSKEPYTLYIIATGKLGEHTYFTLKNLQIISSSGIDYSELIHDLPATIDFKTSDIIFDDYLKGGYFTDYVFFFYDEEIYIKFLIEVSTKEKTEEREMFFTLTKLKRKGLFQSYW